MDNVCHTLFGAALGETGLKARTRFGSPVLMIAANLPDVDVLAFATDTPAVALRRGWTHGTVAQVLLPVVLTGLVLLVDRLRRTDGADRARGGQLLLLSYVGVLTHVALDWLNTYGVRLLMPFSARWFYGDSVFIVDQWLWLMLGAGVFLARRRRRPDLAGVAVLIALLYISGMVWIAGWARQYVVSAWAREHGERPKALMVGPAPVNPLRRSIIIDAGDHYRTGTLRVWSRRVALDARRVPRNDNEPAAIRARDDERVRAVLIWARFPFYDLAPVEGGTRVTVGDMRFPLRLGRMTVVVPHE